MRRSGWPHHRTHLFRYALALWLVHSVSRPVEALLTHPVEPLAPFFAEPSRIGDEITVTGKWVPSRPGGRFRKSPDSADMLSEWEDIHSGARSAAGVLSTEINHAVGEDAVLVHHVFENPDAMVNYFSLLPQITWWRWLPSQHLAFTSYAVARSRMP